VLFLASHCENDAVSLGRDDVWTNLIEIENDASDIWRSAVLRSSNLPHAVGVDRDILCAVVADRVREIQQDAIRVHRSVNFRLNRGTDGDFDP
jgi:hypothetical protein